MFQSPFFYSNENSFDVRDAFRKAAGPDAVLQPLSRARAFRSGRSRADRCAGAGRRSLSSEWRRPTGDHPASRRGPAHRKSRRLGRQPGRYLARCPFIGAQVRIRRGDETICGTARGLATDGKLEIVTADGAVRAVILEKCSEFARERKFLRPVRNFLWQAS